VPRFDRAGTLAIVPIGPTATDDKQLGGDRWQRRGE
jgi:hypothetical protein